MPEASQYTEKYLFEFTSQETAGRLIEEFSAVSTAAATMVANLQSAATEAESAIKRIMGAGGGAGAGAGAGGLVAKFPSREYAASNQQEYESYIAKTLLAAPDPMRAQGYTVAGQGSTRGVPQAASAIPGYGAGEYEGGETTQQRAAQLQASIDQYRQSPGYRNLGKVSEEQLAAQRLGAAQQQIAQEAEAVATANAMGAAYYYELRGGTRPGEAFESVLNDPAFASSSRESIAMMKDGILRSQEDVLLSGQTRVGSYKREFDAAGKTLYESGHAASGGASVTSRLDMKPEVLPTWDLEDVRAQTGKSTLRHYYPGGGMKEQSEDIFAPDDPTRKIGSVSEKFDTAGGSIQKVTDNMQTGEKVIEEYSGALEKQNGFFDKGIGRHMMWIAQGMALYGTYALLAQGAQQWLDVQGKLDQELMQFQMFTGGSAEAAKAYQQEVIGIARKAGVGMFDVSGGAMLAERTGYGETDVPLRAAQLQQVTGMPAETSARELISLRQQLPGMSSEEILNTMMGAQQKSAMNPAEMFAAMEQIGPMMLQYNTTLPKMLGLIAGISTITSESSDQVQQTVKRLDLIYSDPGMRAATEQAIGRPISGYTKAGVEVREPLPDVLEAIGNATQDQQMSIINQAPMGMNASLRAQLLQIFQGGGAIDAATASAENPMTTFDEAVTMSKATFTSQIAEMGNAWTEFLASLGGTHEIKVVIKMVTEGLQGGADALRNDPGALLKAGAGAVSMTNLPFPLNLLVASLQGKGVDAFSGYVGKATEGYAGLVTDPMGAASGLIEKATSWLPPAGQMFGAPPSYRPGAWSVPSSGPGQGFSGAWEQPSSQAQMQERQYYQNDRQNASQREQIFPGMPSKDNRVIVPEGWDAGGLLSLAKDIEQGTRQEASNQGRSMPVEPMVDVSFMDPFGNVITTETAALSYLVQATNAAATQLFQFGGNLSFPAEAMGGESGLQKQIDELDLRFKTEKISVGDSTNKAFKDKSGDLIDLTGSPEAIGSVTSTATTTYSEQESTRKAAESAAKQFSKRMDSLLGAFTDKLMTPSKVTEEDLNAGKMGAYENKWDEPVRRVNDVRDRRMRGLGGAQLGPWVSYAQEAGVDTSSAQSVQSTSEDFTNKFYNMQAPDQYYDWNIMAKQYDDYIAKAEGKQKLKAMLPGKYKEATGKDMDPDRMAAAFGLESPLVGMLSGGSTSKEVGEQIKPYTGAIASGLTDGMKEKLGKTDFAGMIGGVLGGQLSNPDNIKSIVAAGNQVGASIVNGAGQAISDMILPVVIGKIMAGLSNGGGGSSYPPTPIQPPPPVQ